MQGLARGRVHIHSLNHLLDMMHHSGVPVIRHLCTPVFLIYNMRSATVLYVVKRGLSTTELDTLKNY